MSHTKKDAPYRNRWTGEVAHDHRAIPDTSYWVHSHEYSRTIPVTTVQELATHRETLRALPQETFRWEEVREKAWMKFDAKSFNFEHHKAAITFRVEERRIRPGRDGQCDFDPEYYDWSTGQDTRTGLPVACTPVVSEAKVLREKTRKDRWSRQDVVNELSQARALANAGNLDEDYTADMLDHQEASRFYGYSLD